MNLKEYINLLYVTAAEPRTSTKLNQSNESRVRAKYQLPSSDVLISFSEGRGALNPRLLKPTSLGICPHQFTVRLSVVVLLAVPDAAVTVKL